MEQEKKENSTLVFSEVFKVWKIFGWAAGRDKKGVVLAQLVKDDRYEQKNINVKIASETSRLIREVPRYCPHGRVRKILFFGEQLVWSGIVSSLAKRYKNIFLKQELISEILIRINSRHKSHRHGLFADDTLLYGRSGSYHGYLLFKENLTIFIVDVQTSGSNEFQIKIDKLEDFISRHQKYDAHHGKDCPDFFIIPRKPRVVLWPKLSRLFNGLNRKKS